jgi:hypothetical protein
MKVWTEQAADADDKFTFSPGERYAVLASASKNYTVAQIAAYIQGKGFAVTYTWEEGTPTRAEYAIDDWLKAVPADTRDNHRWVYGEGNMGGAAPWTIGRDAPWPFTVYHVAHVMKATDAPDAPLALPSTSKDAPPVQTSRGPGAGVLVGVGLLGGMLIARGRGQR